MASKKEFDQAVKDVKKLSEKPSDKILLELYALYKQTDVGDVTGKRPGMIDVKGRKKYDSWAKIKGKTKESARSEYVKLVKKLLAKSD